MKTIKELVIKCWNNDALRYIFFGGCTTLVNLVCFYLLRLAGLDMNVANVIAVSIAILFAYFVNAKFVFESAAENFAMRFFEFCKFIGARLFCMVIEVAGLWILVEKANMSEFWAKTVIIQIIVLVLNYLFSKFLIFTKQKENE